MGKMIKKRGKVSKYGKQKEDGKYDKQEKCMAKNQPITLAPCGTFSKVWILEKRKLCDKSMDKRKLSERLKNVVNKNITGEKKSVNDPSISWNIIQGFDINIEKRPFLVKFDT